MLKFLIKGVFRDRHRWLLPIVVALAAVSILVFTFSILEGYRLSFERQTSRFVSGHMKVVSRAYAEMLDMKPYDLALLDIEDDLEAWKQLYPQLRWAERINFGALIDIPDSSGNTRVQGDVAGFAIDLFQDDAEIRRMQLPEALQQGRLPQQSGEILITNLAFEKLGLELGETVTLLGSTVYGAMAMQNFIVCGTIEFGTRSLDQGAVVADIEDIRQMMDMPGGAGEILAFFADNEFKSKEAVSVARDFNARYSDPQDEYSPLMLTMMEQGNIGYMMRVFGYGILWMSVGFIMVLGIVLWNSGLISGIRRYGEFGLRLAIGESKTHVYFSLMAEALFTGVAGSVLGVLLGSVISLYFNRFGMDMSLYNQSGNVLTENMLYAKLNPVTLLWGFIPGVLSTLVGAALAGAAIFKRQTSQLFKELET